MNSSPPPYAPSPTSDDLPPIPSVTGVKPNLEFTISAPAVPTLSVMPQVPTPTSQYQVSASGQTSQYQVPASGQTPYYQVPASGQTPHYQVPASRQVPQYQTPVSRQAPTMTLQVQRTAPVPGMISAPQATFQNQKLRIDPYTEKSFIVRGDTKPYKSPLKMMKGRWANKPRDGGEPGWYFGNFNRQEVEKYVRSVNDGTAKPPPTYQVQTVSWSVFKPEDGMKLKIAIPDSVTDYTVASIEKEGWMVIGATIFCPQQPSSVHQIVITNGKWQIVGYNEKHTIEPAP